MTAYFSSVMCVSPNYLYGLGSFTGSSYFTRPSKYWITLLCGSVLGCHLISRYTLSICNSIQFEGFKCLDAADSQIFTCPFMSGLQLL